MKRLIAAALLLTAAWSMTACQENSPSSTPSAVAMTDDALGHYCQMYLADHGGPKAQIHLAGFDEPLWFAQVSDAVAYLHDPERTAEIRAVYVSDMSKAPSWSNPGRENWTAASTAYFVIESKQMGGMGVREAVPFSSEADAQAFSAREDGRVVSFDEISDEYVRPMVEPDEMPLDAHSSHGS